MAQKLCPDDRFCRKLSVPAHKQEFLHKCRAMATCKDTGQTHLTQFLHECFEQDQCTDRDPVHRQIWHGPLCSWNTPAPVVKPQEKPPATKPAEQPQTAQPAKPAEQPKPVTPAKVTSEPTGETKPGAPKASAQRRSEPVPFSGAVPQPENSRDNWERYSRSPPRRRYSSSSSDEGEEVPGTDGWRKMKPRTRSPPRYLRSSGSGY